MFIVVPITLKHTHRRKQKPGGKRILSPGGEPVVAPLSCGLLPFSRGARYHRLLQGARQQWAESLLHCLLFGLSTEGRLKDNGKL